MWTNEMFIAHEKATKVRFHFIGNLHIILIQLKQKKHIYSHYIIKKKEK